MGPFQFNEDDLEGMIGLSMQEKIMGPAMHEENLKHAQVHRMMLEKQHNIIDQVVDLKKAQVYLLHILATILMITWFVALVLGVIWFVKDVLNA